MGTGQERAKKSARAARPFWSPGAATTLHAAVLHLIRQTLARDDQLLLSPGQHSCGGCAGAPFRAWRPPRFPLAGNGCIVQGSQAFLRAPLPAPSARHGHLAVSRCSWPACLWAGVDEQATSAVRGAVLSQEDPGGVPGLPCRRQVQPRPGVSRRDGPPHSGGGTTCRCAGDTCALRSGESRTPFGRRPAFRTFVGRCCWADACER